MVIGKKAVSGLAGFFWMAVSLVGSGCSGNRSTPVSPGNAGGDTLKPAPFRKPPATKQDTLTIKGMSAVFFQADSLQWEKTKALLDANHYETEEHNCYFLMRNARKSLGKSWPAIRITETSRVRFLQFIRDDKESTVIDLDRVNDLCGIYLFDGQKDPELADMMNIDTSLGFYFKKGT